MKYLAEEYEKLQTRLNRMKEISEWMESFMNTLGPDWHCYESIGGNLQNRPSIYFTLNYKETSNYVEYPGCHAEMEIYVSLSTDNIQLKKIGVYFAQTKENNHSNRDIRYLLDELKLSDIEFIKELGLTINGIAYKSPNSAGIVLKKLQEYKKLRAIEKDFKKRGCKK